METLLVLLPGIFFFVLVLILLILGVGRYTTEDVEDRNRKKRTTWDDDSIWKDDIHTDIGYNSIPGNLHHSDNDTF
ncbi:MAG: hypothetical protein JXB42_07645 [Deltaproteobacteria bacterium]|nr:hypothetical protein [Deltaproteobacteria bacterium]